MAGATGAVLALLPLVGAMKTSTREQLILVTAVLLPLVGAMKTVVCLCGSTRFYELLPLVGAMKTAPVEPEQVPA